MMIKDKRFYLVTVVILFCSCVSFFSGLGLGVGLSDAINLPGFETEMSTADRADEATEVSAAEPGMLLFEDDFSDESWEIREDVEHQKGYEAGRYFILAKADGFDYWSTAGRAFSDFSLEVETTQLAGPDNNNYGIIFRHQDRLNFYKFEISGDGYYSFSKVVAGEFSEIIPWEKSELINQGHSRNTLRIKAVGSGFAFSINDQLANTVTDSALDEGDIGLIVGAFDEGGVHVAFDNLKVMAVPNQ
jgi:hypothetical protein